MYLSCVLPRVAEESLLVHIYCWQEGGGRELERVVGSPKGWMVEEGVPVDSVGVDVVLGEVSDSDGLSSLFNVSK
jgi:hypothetical protein